MAGRKRVCDAKHQRNTHAQQVTVAYADAVDFTETPDCLLYEDKTNLTFPFTGSVNYNCTFTLASRVTNVTAPISYIDSSFFYFKATTPASGELHVAPRAFPSAASHASSRPTPTLLASQVATRRPRRTSPLCTSPL